MDRATTSADALQSAEYRLAGQQPKEAARRTTSRRNGDNRHEEERTERDAGGRGEVQVEFVSEQFSVFCRAKGLVGRNNVYPRFGWLAGRAGARR